MGKEPSGTIRAKTKVSLQLQGRYTLFMRTHRVERLNPLAKGYMATVHYSFNRDRELLTAIVTFDYPIPNLVGFGV
jgi:hypothetical protein